MARKKKQEQIDELLESVYTEAVLIDAATRALNRIRYILRDDFPSSQDDIYATSFNLISGALYQKRCQIWDWIGQVGLISDKAKKMCEQRALQKFKQCRGDQWGCDYTRSSDVQKALYEMFNLKFNGNEQLGINGDNMTDSSLDGIDSLDKI